MKKKTLIVLLIVALAGIISCVENESSFYISHMKTQPTAPDCKVSIGDSWQSSGVLDIAFGNPYHAVLEVTNQLIPTEDKDNHRTETNSIFITGIESYTEGIDTNYSSGTSRYIFENNIPPLSEAVAAGYLITPEVVDELQGIFECNSLTGNSSLSRHLGDYYANVRFLGHTAGGVKVETPWFSIIIEVCCGCLVDWTDCANISCHTYCDDPKDHNMCTLGVANGGEEYDCKNIYYDKSRPECASCN